MHLGRSRRGCSYVRGAQIQLEEGFRGGAVGSSLVIIDSDIMHPGLDRDLVNGNESYLIQNSK